MLEVIFRRPTGPPIAEVTDIVPVRMDSLDFLSQEIEANETVIIEEERHSLNYERLRDSNDSYASL